MPPQDYIWRDARQFSEGMPQLHSAASGPPPLSQLLGSPTTQDASCLSRCAAFKLLEVEWIRMELGKRPYWHDPQWGSTCSWLRSCQQGKHDCLPQRKQRGLKGASFTLRTRPWVNMGKGSRFGPNVCLGCNYRSSSPSTPLHGGKAPAFPTPKRVRHSIVCEPLVDHHCTAVRSWPAQLS
jgi:hypothetical protein